MGYNTNYARTEFMEKMTVYLKKYFKKGFNCEDNSIRFK